MIPIILAAVLVASAPTGAPPSAAQAAAAAHKAAAQKAIDAGNAAYISTWQHGDAHAFAMLYTPDAASISDDGTITRGRAAIEAAQAKAFATSSLLKGTITTEDLVVEDSIGYEMGSYSFTLKAPGKPAVVLTGRYLTIWQQQPDGTWLIETDSGLSDRTCTKRPS